MAMTAMQAIFYILPIALILLQMFILRYLWMLEKTGCECAMDWRRDFIMAYFVITIIITVINLILSGDVKLPMIPNLILLGMGWMSVVFALQYIHRLKKEKCECSESVYRSIMYIMAMIQAGILVLSVALIVLTFLMVSVRRMVGPKLDLNSIERK